MLSELQNEDYLKKLCTSLDEFLMKQLNHDNIHLLIADMRYIYFKVAMLDLILGRHYF